MRQICSAKWPQCRILYQDAMGRMNIALKFNEMVRNGEIVIRTMMNLSLTADHRVIDGVMASKFLKRIAELLENPYMLLV